MQQGTGAAPKETPLPAVEPIPDNPSVVRTTHPRRH
jgi:hypothetical protein